MQPSKELSLLDLPDDLLGVIYDAQIEPSPFFERGKFGSQRKMQADKRSRQAFRTCHPALYRYE